MLCTRKKPGMQQPTMNGKKIGFVSNMKLVGFTIVSKLNWEKTIACTAASRGKSMRGALYRMQSLLKPNDLQDVYKSFVRSKMDFGSIEYIAAAPTRYPPGQDYFCTLVCRQWHKHKVAGMPLRWRQACIYLIRGQRIHF